MIYYSMYKNVAMNSQRSLTSIISSLNPKYEINVDLRWAILNKQILEVIERKELWIFVEIVL